MSDKEVEALSKAMRLSNDVEDSLIDYVLNRNNYEYGTEYYWKFIRMIKKLKEPVYQLTLSEKQYAHNPQIRNKLSSLKAFIDLAIPRVVKIPGGHYEGTGIDNELFWISDYIADYLYLDQKSEESLSEEDISELIKGVLPKQDVRDLEITDYRRWLDNIFERNLGEVLSGEREEKERKLNAIRDAQIRAMRMKEDREAEEELSKSDSPEETFLDAVISLLREHKKSQSLTGDPEAYLEDLSKSRYPDNIDQCVDLILEVERRE
jgi:hypothetical protein